MVAAGHDELCWRSQWTVLVVIDAEVEARDDQGGAKALKCERLAEQGMDFRWG